MIRIVDVHSINDVIARFSCDPRSCTDSHGSHGPILVEYPGDRIESGVAPIRVEGGYGFDHMGSASVTVRYNNEHVTLKHAEWVRRYDLAKSGQMSLFG
jgi:hypothetical protein